MLTPRLALIGTWYLAPASDPRDEHAAGYDENVFAFREEAEAAIPSLRAIGPEFAVEWIAVERRG